jgi:hypothetical protein
VALLTALAALAVLLQGWQRGGSGSREGGETPRGQSGLVEPLELRREDIPPLLLDLAGGGDPAQAPPELAAVLGDGRFLLPRVGGIGGWMDQSPDEKILAVPHEEDLVLFEVPTGKYLRRLKGPGGLVVRVSFSRDGQLLAVTTWNGGMDGAVRVWDLCTDKELFTKPVPGRKVSGQPPSVPTADVSLGRARNGCTCGMPIRVRKSRPCRSYLEDAGSFASARTVGAWPLHSGMAGTSKSSTGTGRGWWRPTP